MGPQQTAPAAVAPAARRRLRLAANGRADAQLRAERAPEHALDTLLELLERRRLPAAELRLLLAVRDGERSVSELSETFGRPSVEIRRTGARLYARGLLDRRHDAASKEPVFGVTRTGLATLRPLLTAVGMHAQAV